MDGVIFILVIGVVVFFIVRKFVKKAKTRAQFKALPADGPMQVDLQEETFPPGSFNSKRFKCTLKIKIIISQADWKAIADMGLMKKILFESPNAAGDVYDPENVTHWKVEDLKIFNGQHDRTGVAFNDVNQMQETKEQLIEGLHNLRDLIDNHRYGSKKESLQI